MTFAPPLLCAIIALALSSCSTRSVSQWAEARAKVGTTVALARDYDVGDYFGGTFTLNKHDCLIRRNPGYRKPSGKDKDRLPDLPTGSQMKIIGCRENHAANVTTHLLDLAFLPINWPATRGPQYLFWIDMQPIRPAPGIPSVVHFPFDAEVGVKHLPWAPDSDPAR